MHPIRIRRSTGGGDAVTGAICGIGAEYRSGNGCRWHASYPGQTPHAGRGCIPQQQGSEIERGRGGARMNDVRQSWTLIQQGHALTGIPYLWNGGNISEL